MTTITAVTQEERPATLVDWSMAPDWVSIDLAAFLTGLDAGAIDQAITLAGVEAMERDGKLLIDRDSLRDFWEMVHAVGADGRLSDDP